MDLQTIPLDANKALALIENLLPMLEQFAPVAGPVGGEVALGAGAAQVAIPILMEINSKLAEQGVTTPETQQSTLDRFNKVLSMFTQPQWQPSAPPPQTGG